MLIQIFSLSIYTHYLNNKYKKKIICNKYLIHAALSYSLCCKITEKYSLNFIFQKRQAHIKPILNLCKAYFKPV